MMDARRAIAWDVQAPAFDALRWLESWLSSWNARFGSWKNSGDDDEMLCTADPELVAALQFIASLVADEPRDNR